MANHRDGLASMLDAGSAGPQISQWSKSSSESFDSAVVIAGSQLGLEYLQTIPGLNQSELSMFSPIWTDAKCVLARLNSDSTGASLDVEFTGKTPDDIQTIGETLIASKVMAKNFLKSHKNFNFSSIVSPEGIDVKAATKKRFDEQVVELFESALNNTTIKHNTSVELKTRVDISAWKYSYPDRNASSENKKWYQ